MIYNYTRGLQALKSLLVDEEAQNDFAVYESQLTANLRREQLYSSTETLRAERAAIIDQLNRLARKQNTSSFNDLCNPPQTSLANKGYGFSSEHTRNIDQTNKGKIEEHPKPPEITNTLLIDMVPTAYYHRLDSEQFPLVTILINNSGEACVETALTVLTVIEDYSDRSITSFVVAKGEIKEVSLLPVLKAERVAVLDNIQNATIHVTVQQSYPITAILYDHTWRTHLLARNVVLLGQKEPNNQVRDLTKFLAAWVTPYHPQILELLARAAKYHPDKKFVGYREGTQFPKITDNIHEQVRAIFQVIKNEVPMNYNNPQTIQGASKEQIVQRVQLPSQSLQSRLINCIEGAVLFASLLEAASIDAVIVLVSDHAFVGWHISRSFVGWLVEKSQKGDEQQYDFLETTIIKDASFEEAIQDALDQFDEAKRQGDFERALFDPQGFARFIEVPLCRREGIYSLE